jgi:hypothetical protein
MQKKKKKHPQGPRKLNILYCTIYLILKTNSEKDAVLDDGRRTEARTDTNCR